MTAKELPKDLFKQSVAFFIPFTQDNPMYRFTGIEGTQLKNILVRLYNGIEKKYGTTNTEQVYTAFEHTIIFAKEHGYTLTCMNIINKLNNIFQHIKNEGTNNRNKGYITVFRFTATEVTNNAVECLKQVYELYCRRCVEKPENAG
jgi:hypothetical protein